MLLGQGRFYKFPWIWCFWVIAKFWKMPFLFLTYVFTKWLINIKNLLVYCKNYSCHLVYCLNTALIVKHFIIFHTFKHPNHAGTYVTFQIELVRRALGMYFDMAIKDFTHLRWLSRNNSISGRTSFKTNVYFSGYARFSRACI